MLKLPLLQKCIKLILKLNMLKLIQLNFKKTLILSNKLKSYLGHSELSDIEIPKKVPHRYHAAHFSCANLQLSPKTMLEFFNEFQSAVTLPKTNFASNLPSKI